MKVGDVLLMVGLVFLIPLAAVAVVQLVMIERQLSDLPAAIHHVAIVAMPHD